MHNYILKRLQNDSLMTKTLKLAKIDKIDLQFLHLVLGAITIFIISHKEIQIIGLFVERLRVLCDLKLKASILLSLLLIKLKFRSKIC